MAPNHSNLNRPRWENPPGVDPLMPSAWLAERWGITTVRLHQRFRAAEIPGAFRVGKSWRIRLSDVYRYEQSQMPQPATVDPAAAHEEQRTEEIVQARAQALAQQMAREQEERVRQEFERKLNLALAGVALSLRKELGVG